MWDYTATQHIVLADMMINGVKRSVLLQAPKNGIFYVLDRQNGQLISATPYEKINWASGVDSRTGRPLENPDARYADTGKPWIALPGPLARTVGSRCRLTRPVALCLFRLNRSGLLILRTITSSITRLAVNLGVDLAAASLRQDVNAKAKVLESVQGHLIAWTLSKERRCGRSIILPAGMPVCCQQMAIW